MDCGFWPLVNIGRPWLDVQMLDRIIPPGTFRGMLHEMHCLDETFEDMPDECFWNNFALSFKALDQSRKVSGVAVLEVKNFPT